MALIKPRALQYFKKYGLLETIKWVEEDLRNTSKADLELLSTVDFATLGVDREGNAISVITVRDLIASEPEWAAKLDQEPFSGENIATALKKLGELFGDGETS